MDMIFAINQWVPVYYIYAFSFLESDASPLCGAYIGTFCTLVVSVVGNGCDIRSVTQVFIMPNWTHVSSKVSIGSD